MVEGCTRSCYALAKSQHCGCCEFRSGGVVAHEAQTRAKTTTLEGTLCITLSHPRYSSPHHLRAISKNEPGQNLAREITAGATGMRAKQTTPLIDIVRRQFGLCPINSP